VQEKAMEDYIVSLPSSIFIIYVILDHCNDQDDDDEQMVDVGLREKADPKSKAKPAGRVLGRLCGLHPPSSSKTFTTINITFIHVPPPKASDKTFSTFVYSSSPHSFNYIVFPTRKKKTHNHHHPSKQSIFLGLQ
jgi:hypothetical protein